MGRNALDTVPGGQALVVTDGNAVYGVARSRGSCVQGMGRSDRGAVRRRWEGADRDGRQLSVRHCGSRASCNHNACCGVLARCAVDGRRRVWCSRAAGWVWWGRGVSAGRPCVVGSGVAEGHAGCAERAGPKLQLPKRLFVKQPLRLGWGSRTGRHGRGCIGVLSVL